MDKKIIIATIKKWNIDRAKDFLKKNIRRYEVLIIDKADDFKIDVINNFSPDYIFFPHWSWKIPEEVYANFQCVVFHMTDLPFGRGGSPLQNLIVRGYKNTVISALRVVEQIDAGPVYLKKPLSLDGTACEIFERASEIIFNEMIPAISEGIAPREQSGVPVIFKRRQPQESDISGLDDLSLVFDHIRMLDAEGYPNAFIEKNSLLMEFFSAKYCGDFIEAKVRIKIRRKYEE